MILNINQNFIFNLLIESLVIILILFSPLIYGSVTILPLSLLEAISFFVLFIFLLKNLLKKEIDLIKIPILPIILFLFLIIFQVFSLPRSFLSFLSPSTFSLYRDFRINPLFSLTSSIYPESTVNMLLQFLSYLAVFLVILNFNNTEKKINRLVLLIIISGFVYSLFGIMTRDLSTTPIQFSTFTNRGHFAAYLEMVVFVCMGYSLTDISINRRIISIFMASVMILAIFLTASRGGRVCFLLSLFPLLFLLKIKRPIKRTISVMVILFLFFSLFIGLIGLGPLTQRMETLLNPFKAYSDRFQLVKDSLKIVKDFPFFGTGLGTFTHIAQKYKTTDWQVTYGFSHNEPIQLLVETGITGFLLLFLFFFKYLSKIFSLWLKRRNPFAVYITLGILVGIISSILHSMVEFTFHVPANALLFFIILALLYRTVYIKQSKDLLSIPESKLILPKYLRISFIGVLLLSLIFVESLIFRRYQAEIIFQKVKQKKVLETDVEAIIEYNKMLKEIDKAIALNPLRGGYPSKKADILSEIALREDLEYGLYSMVKFKDANEVLNLARRLYQRAIDLKPTDADFHLNLGWLYGLVGEIDLVHEEFKKALLLDPQNIVIQSYVQPYLGVK